MYIFKDLDFRDFTELYLASSTAAYYNFVVAVVFV